MAEQWVRNRVFPYDSAYASRVGSTRVVGSPMRGRRFSTFGSSACDLVVIASSTRCP